MPVYPGDPEVATAPATSIATDGFAVTALQLGTHSGTHVDAPSHSIEGGDAIDEIDPARLMGRARILRVSVRDGEMIGVTGGEIKLRAWDGERIALVHTGWDAHWGTPRMLQHPAVSVELADARTSTSSGSIGGVRLWRGARVIRTSAAPSCLRSLWARAMIRSPNLSDRLLRRT